MAALSTPRRRIFGVFFAMLLLKPVLELATGLLKFLGIDAGAFSPSRILYVFIIILGLFYVFLSCKKVFFFLCGSLGLGFALSLFGEIFRRVDFSFKADVEYFSQFALNILVMAVFLLALNADRQRAVDAISTLFLSAAFVYSLGIILPFLLKTGFSTYDDYFGQRGFKGFFFAGNDIAALLLIISFILVVFAFSKPLKRSIPWVVATGLSLCALWILSTKAALLGFFLLAAASVGLALYFFFAKKDRASFLRLIIIFAVVFVVFLLSAGRFFQPFKNTVEAITDYTDMGDNTMVLLSGRQVWLEGTFSRFKKALPLSLLTGIGRGTMNKVVEMDIFEIFLYYGIVGGALIAFSYFFMAFRIIKGLISAISAKRVTLFMVFSLFSLILVFGLLFIAGHVLFSPISGPYWGAAVAFCAVAFDVCGNPFAKKEAV